jgi:hypothetical protein
LKVIRAERITDLYADRAAGRRALGKDILLFLIYLYLEGWYIQSASVSMACIDWCLVKKEVNEQKVDEQS